MEEATPAATDNQSYWLRWQVPVCALIFILPALVSVTLIINRNRRIKAPLGPSNSIPTHHHLWVPCWRFLHPRWLLIYRALAFFTMAAMLYQFIITLGLFTFFFYTQWTFTLVIVYFGLGTLVSVHGCWTLSAKSSESGEQADKAIRFWGNLMEHIYQACAGAVMLTDIVFWCLLVPFMLNEEFQLTLLIAFMHSINAVFLILDSFLNSIPFPWFGLVYFVLWSCSYIIFQWALHLCCVAWWPYPFLDLSNPWAPMWYLAMALIHIPCYGLYMLIVKAKDFICSRLFSDSYKRISSDKKQP
ncbi:OLC1v1003643C1 [Oldenlandia corymbosa var. corymbosa]|uniref:OLC1v1003643C1 n=1 Tax=Oldenlandia corymbosa var. corymbosa TaxID=529605 RepID=A0AAV1DAG7_OLDCO|nr:OLC1v1003643C1 [Oldenlandia corymbosa var. corymbosa]